MDDPALISELRAAVYQACAPAYVPYIREGRRRVAALPRAWVLRSIERIGREELCLADFWEYGRLLELLDEIGAVELLRQLVPEGLASTDVDVRDMAGLWVDRVREQPGGETRPTTPKETS